MKKIIFPYSYTTLQTAMILLYFTVLIPKAFVFQIFDYTSPLSDLTPLLLPKIIRTIIAIPFLLALFIKKGVLIQNNNLYKAYFLYASILYKKQILLDNISDISILKFKMKRPLSSFTVYSENALLSEGELSFERNEIYLLNKRHSIKRFLIHTKNHKLAKETVETIKNHFKFTYKSYSPHFR